MPKNGYIVDETGINIFVIDRVVNSLAVAKLFKRKQWGLLSMADSNDSQENAFKRMNRFCGLNTTHGIKKETVSDRHQERKKKELEQQLSSKHGKIEKTKGKIVEQK